MPFGLEYVEAALAAQGRVLVVDGAESTDDIVRDLHEVIGSLYGKRAAKNRAKNAIEAMQCE
jgi:putative resolvase